MSKREWQPGDVAIRTGADGSTVTSLVVRADRRRIDCWDNHGEADHWHHSNGGWNTIPDDPAFGTYRPLVVIDPEDREQVAKLRDAIWPHGAVNLLANWQQALRDLADPTPDEPTGLGAVVEDDRGVRWVRVESAKGMTNPWQATLHAAETDAVRNLRWVEVQAVRVLSEGVPR